MMNPFAEDGKQTPFISEKRRGNFEEEEEDDEKGNPFAEKPKRPSLVNPFQERPKMSPPSIGNPFSVNSNTRANVGNTPVLGNPFAEDIQNVSLVGVSPRISSPPGMMKHVRSETKQFKLSTIEHKELGIRNISIAEDLSLLVTQSNSTDLVISRRDMTSFSRPDGSITFRDPIEWIHMDVSGTHALISVHRGSKSSQLKDGIFYINPQDAILKARGPFAALNGATTTCWLDDEWDYNALIGFTNGEIHSARFTHNGGLSELNLFYSSIGSSIVSIVAKNNIVLIMSTNGKYSFVDTKGKLICSGEIVATSKIEVISTMIDEVDESEYWILTRNAVYRISFSDQQQTLKVVTSELIFEQESLFAMTQTKLHVLLLSRQATKQSTLVSTKLTAISKISLSSSIIEKLKPSIHGSPPLQFARDEKKNKVWMISDKGVCQVEILDESNGAWNLYLSRARDTDNEKYFYHAMEWCNTKIEKDNIRAAQADWNLKKKHFVKAAELYAETSNSVKSFEEIALALSSSSIRNDEATSSLEEMRERKKALRVYLLGKLNHVSDDKKTIRTMLCTWICEAFLDEMDYKIQNTENNNEEDSKEQETISSFCSFLGSYSTALEPGRDVIFHLILSHGRVDMLLVYAHLTKDYDRVVTHHLHQGSPLEAVRALQDFAEQQRQQQEDDSSPNARNFACELIYKHSPAIIVLCPEALVETWMNIPELEPVRLAPALSRYTENETVREWVIRYLNHCIESLGIRDEAIHNLLLSAYSSDENKLYHFIKGETSQPGGFCFDSGFALRLCSTTSPRSRILLLDAMNMPEAACRAALELKMRDVAQRIAAEQIGNEELGKRLWILCCKDALLENESPSKKALDVLRASNGVISVEDLLTLLPDSVKVDELRDEVCTALERYNAEIEKLKNEMNEHTESAQALRRDAVEEKRRFDVIRASKSCDACGSKLFNDSSSTLTLATGVDEFYIFPCTHVFHSKCLCEQVIRNLHGDRRDRVSRLTVSDSEEDQALLEEIIGAACPFCGELMIQSVAHPLVFARDEQFAASWE